MLFYNRVVSIETFSSLQHIFNVTAEHIFRTMLEKFFYYANVVNILRCAIENPPLEVFLHPWG